MPILARILRERGIVTEQQLQAAIHHQVLYGGRLGTNLYELGFITEERLAEALARAHGVPAASVDSRQIQAEAVSLLSKAVASRHKVFPYRVRSKTVFLLMINPGDHAALAKIGYSLGHIVKPLVVPEFRMIQLLRDYYDVDELWRYTDTHRRAGAAAAANGRSPEERVESATTRDEVVEALLALSLRFFRRVVFFIVKEPWVLGWSGAGEGMDRSLAAGLRIPLDEPSVFQMVIRGKTVFIGRLGPEEENQRFLSSLAKRPNTNAAFLPVTVKGRVVNLVYGDNGAAGNVKGDLGELIVLVQKVSKAYLRIIRKRIAEVREGHKATSEEESRE